MKILIVGMELAQLFKFFYENYCILIVKQNHPFNGGTSLISLILSDNYY